MIPDFFRLTHRHGGSGYDRAFLKEIRVQDRPPRNPRVERLILACWVLILLKSFAVLWVFDHYRIPINPLWVIAPTVVFAGLCTAVYHWRQ